MRDQVRVNRAQTGLAVVLCVAASSCGGSSDGDFNGCTAAQFVDRTAASASRVVGYGGASGSTLFSYSPKCITVAVGQTVTFTGGTSSNFGVHPLGPGINGDATAGTAGNPVPRMATGSDVTVTFTAAGTFPYVCEAHAAAGMVGVVRVQ